MKIVMTLLVRDEEDILADNLDYHLAQGVDFVIATDNRSVDATPDILRDYERRGVLRYLYEAGNDYSQHAWVTRMARMAATEYGADWVINNDADEFWWPSQTGSLREAFAAAEAFNVLQAARMNFMPVEPTSACCIQRMTCREAVATNPLGRPLPPKVAHRADPRVEVAQGNHSVSGLPEPRVLEGALEIFHYPIRSYAQLENRVVNGGAAYARNGDLPEAIGNTTRYLYAKYQAGELVNYFLDHFYDAERREDALRAGKLIRDERLAAYFSRRGLGARCPRGHHAAGAPQKR